VFARVEVAIRPEFADPAATNFLRKAELAQPELRKKIRWARMLDVYWLEIPAAREEMIHAIGSIYWDRVLQWLFTGNLIPSAAGKSGNVQDLCEAAPNRPGEFWALERHFRPGVTDNVGRTALEAFEITLRRKFPEGRVASGNLLLIEGPGLTEDELAVLSREVFCNELIETWTVIPASELRKSDRFHQERIKRDIPKMLVRGSSDAERFDFAGMTDEQLMTLNQKRLWAFSKEELAVIREHFSQRGKAAPTDVEIEVIAQTWSEHCKHKIFDADIEYKDSSGEKNVPGSAIPHKIRSLFKSSITATTQELRQPWLLSVFEDNAGIVAFDEEDALCIKVETHNTPSALDPYGGALTGIVGVNRDILGCGLGARPIFNTDVFCVGPLDYSQTLPERLFHPRRILSGIRQGVEHGGNKSGIPTVNGALIIDERYLGKPLVYCGTGGIMPRTIAGRPCESKEVNVGDRVVMLGGRVGKDGIHGATFSSLALDQNSPQSAVQLGDPLTQKRMTDFLLVARDKGLYRALTDNGAGGLSSSVGEMARITNGARVDVSRAKPKYPGLKPYELMVSESQERMTLAVPSSDFDKFCALAAQFGVEVSDLGEFTETGKLEIFYGEEPVGSLDLKFLHQGGPKLKLSGEWKGLPVLTEIPASGKTPETLKSFSDDGIRCLLDLLGSPNIASKEWLIRQYDHEVQGTSVIKPLHTTGTVSGTGSSGPNDGAVLKPKYSSNLGVAVGCGINPKLSDHDPYLMAQSVVDEAVRNLLTVGAEYGKPESMLALVDNFCWPDPVGDSGKTAALVRACYGLRDACLELKAPLVSGKDSMKNDYRGKRGSKPLTISIPPTLLITGIGKVPDISLARSADFKTGGDTIYLLGGDSFGLRGSEFATRFRTDDAPQKLGQPDWALARKVYSWIGGGIGQEQGKLRSLHDVSDGGMLVAISESILARGLGAVIIIPGDKNIWEFSFGEGFHSFIATVSDWDVQAMEAEWKSLGVPFFKIGAVISQERLDVSFEEGVKHWSISTKQLRTAWQKAGYWE